MKKQEEKSELLEILLSHTIDIPQEEYALLETMAKTNSMTVDQCVCTVIRNNLSWSEEKEKEIPIAKAEMVVVTLEMVWAQLNDKEIGDDLSAIKSNIAGDLVVAKIGLEFEKTGKFDKAKVKDLISEYF